MLEPQPCLLCTHDAHITVSMAITSDAYLPAADISFSSWFYPCFTGRETNVQRLGENVSEYTQAR